MLSLEMKTGSGRDAHVRFHLLRAPYCRRGLVCAGAGPSDAYRLAAALVGPLAQVCRDSCLEFFFGPDGGARYFNFEFNPLGTLCLGFGAGRSTRVRQVPKDLGQFQIEPFLTPKG